MAATITWVDPNLSSIPVKRGQVSQMSGAQGRAFVNSWVKAVADGDGTIYYIAEISANAVFLSLLLNNDALAGATSASLGYYRLNADGTISDTAKSDGTSGKAVLMSAADINAGSAIGSERNGLSAVSIANLEKKVWELLGFTNPGLKDDSYILALTLTTAGAATGNLALRGHYTQG